MTDDRIIADAQWLIGNLNPRESKWLRSFNRIANNNRRGEALYETHGSPISFILPSLTPDAGATPLVNLCDSVVQTHVSKLAQTKVRPHINVENSGFRSRKIARTLQLFLDQMYAEQGVYSNTIECQRDADIFEYGTVWIDEESFCNGIHFAFLASLLR